MADVFVVRQFFEDSGDDQTLGVYTDFWKAIAETAENRKVNQWDKYEFKTQDIYGVIWRELFNKGYGTGIYYTIEKMELNR